MSFSQKMSIEKPQQATSAPAYAWLVLFVVLLAGIAAPLNQFKVPPLLPVLIEKLQLDLNTAGMLMSIFAITGLILSLPAGMILQKLGSKRTGLMAIGFLTLGSALGALSNSANLLFFSRLIEGAGMGLIAVVAPAIIADWFPADQRGVPMGIWATWVPLGCLIMLNLAPRLEAATNWQMVWWVGAGFSLLTFILYSLVIRPPDTAPVTEASAPTPNLRQALANPHIWLLALSFGCMNLVLIGVTGTYYPTFLNQERGFTLANAASLSSIGQIVTIIGAPIAGWLTDRAGKRKPFLLASFAALAVWMIFPFSTSAAWAPMLLILSGLLAVFIPTVTFSAAPEVMGNPQLAGIGLAVIILFQNLGQLVGPMIFGRLVEQIGWAAAGYWMAPVFLIGLGAAWATKMR